MFLLSTWIFIFLFVIINFGNSCCLIPGILFSDGFDLSIIHMIDYNNFFLYIINSDFGNLLFGLFLWCFFELSWHFLYTHSSNMIVIIVIILGIVNFIFFCLYKGNTLCDEPIITIGIQLNCPLTNFLNSLYESIWVSVWIVIDYSHSSVNFSDFFPMWHLAWTIILHSLKLVRVSIFTL